MMWLVVLGVLAPVLLFVLWQTEQLGKTNKTLQKQLAQREQESIRLQQAAYQLAEQQKTLLEQQLALQPAQPLLSNREMQLARMLCLSLPVVIKECCQKAVLPQQVLKQQLRHHPGLDSLVLEQMMKKHSRLTTLWQSNTIMAYIQLCSVVAGLAGEEAAAKVSNL